MKTFYEMLELLEMPLTHYGYQFNLPNDSGEMYDSKTGNQYVSKKFKDSIPWGGEKERIVQSGIIDRFSSRDKKLISHPRTFRVLENKLKNSKFNFNIIMMELKKFNSGVTSNYWDDIVKGYLKENNIGWVNSITFVKNASSGHVLTPWMILHTLGHALFNLLGSYHKNAIKDSLDKIYNIIQDKGIGKNEFYWPWGVVFDFKSAKASSIDDADELVHELVAEYLWNNKIRVNAMVASIKEINNEIKIIEKNIIEVLESCVGSIVYDIS